jgi:CheY-like chemotaxis protein/two-component sensor histidine kinase
VAVEVADATEGDRLRLVESLGLVAGGIAHDFNNQLVSVLGEASAAREDSNLSPQVQQALERIEAAAQRMATTTRQLLAYAGRGRLVTSLIDPDDLVALMQDQLQRSVRRDAELFVSVSRTHSAVQADPALLTEVVVNLVINASESLPPSGGTVRVATGILPREGGAAWWRLEVTDDGAGMDAGTVMRIFDPFFTTKPERHGLGLSAVYGIVRRIGGEISVDSKPGSGTTFHVRLPIVSGAQAIPTTAPSVPPRRGTLTGVNVLVADDETTVRSTIRRLLERRGATVIVASDGDEAATRLRERTYDLVVLDVMMPKLTGYQLLPIARETQPKAKVMLMSGYTDARGGNGQLEPDAFLEKPFTAKQLEDLIGTLLA